MLVSLSDQRWRPNMCTEICHVAVHIYDEIYEIWHVSMATDLAKNLETLPPVFMMNSES